MKGNNQKKRPKIEKEYDYFIKVVVVGKSGVGKSSLMLRFCEGTFNDFHVNTIGVDFRFKTIQVKGKRTKIQIWDTAGQEKFRTISSAYYRGADVVLLVYDITCAQSLEDLKNYWVQEVEKHGLEVPTLVMVGNKEDMSEIREVPKFKEKTYPLQYGNLNREAMLYEVSAKTDYGINKVFEDMAINHIRSKEYRKAGKSILLRSVDGPLSQINEEEEDGSNSHSSAGEKANKLKSIHLEPYVESPTKKLASSKLSAEIIYKEEGCGC